MNCEKNQFDSLIEKIKKMDKTNSSEVLKLARKYAKLDLSSMINAKVAVLGTCSIQLITSTIRMMLSKYGMFADIYEGEYNGLKLDIFDENSEFYQFQPDYVIMIPDYRDVMGLPDILDSTSDVNEKVEKSAKIFFNMFEKIHQRLPKSQILMTNIVEPVENALGNLAGNYYYSTSTFYKLINMYLMNNRPSYVTLVDIESLASYVGKMNWFDESGYFLNKSGFSLNYIGEFCDAIARQFLPLSGKPNKCLVLDLDNTLWGGVVGDDGPDGIILDPNDAIGEAYQAFQDYVLKLKQRGIILAVCSKNEFELAKEPFDINPNMKIKFDDISCFVANWNDKVSNIRAIAEQLNIGIDSLVFFDDNPTEREIVSTYLPEVTVIDVPEDPALYVRALDKAFAFEWAQITDEDISRSQTYIDNKKREELMAEFVDYGEYLKALEMEVCAEEVSEKTISRFAQLINKSNQFNLRTQRYSEAQVIAMLSNDSYKLLTISLNDKFSNYGIIACVILKFEGKECFVDTWVMSCRVLKKGVEDYTFMKIVEGAKEKGAELIIGEYIPTRKNRMVSELYEQLGFECVEENDGTKRYVLDTKSNANIKKEHYLKEVAYEHN